MSRVIEVSQVERRRDWRRQVLLDAVMDGHPVKVLDVGSGGFGAVLEIEGEGNYLPDVGSKVDIEIAPEAGQFSRFQVEVTRLDPVTGKFGARFRNLTDSQYKIVERMTLGRWY